MSGPRAIVVEKPGGYHRLELRAQPRPPLGPKDVRVAVRAIGVNYADTLVRMGVYGAVKSYPITPGFEYSGIVEETGPEVRRVKPGDAVFGVTRFGAYATEVTVPEDFVWPKPAAWSFEEAAGFPAVALTAYHGLVHLAHVQPGEKVLIHSAAGGVGTAALQLARLKGASVAAVVGGAHKIETCRALGAEAVIDKSAHDLWAEAEKFAPGGYDVILDANGYTTLKRSYEHLAPSGRLLVYGFASMLPKLGGKVNWLALAFDWLRTPSFDPLKLCSENRAVIGFNVVYLFEKAAAFDAAVKVMLGWAEEGRLKAPLVTVYPFEEAGRAHKDLESGRTVGKLILAV